MVSLKQNVVCTLAVIMVFMLVSSYARPVAEEDWPSDEEVEKILHSPVIAAHVRSYARKRHAEIRLSSEISRRMAELKRIQALNQLMADLDTSKVYTVQNNSRSGRAKEDARERRSRNRQTQLRNLNNEEVYPTAPSNREIAPQLLKQLNGRTLAGGVKMRIVSGTQTQRNPPSAHQFKKYIENAKNAVAVAKTCQEMQEMISRGNLRLRVRCQTTRNSRRQHRHS